MKRKLVIAVPELTPAQRSLIGQITAENGFQTEFYETEEAALPAVQDAEIIFAFAPELARHAPQLKWYCASSAGVDRFTDPSLYASKDAVLTNSSGAYGITISEHVIMMVLEVLRRQEEYRELIRMHEWKRGLPVRSVFDSRITLVGTGNIGQETAKRMRAFLPKRIVGVNRSGQNPEQLFDQTATMDHLDEVLSETDILVLSLPKTDATFHVLDAAKLASLPEQALVVNVGRGSCIDQAALVKELQKRRLWAALDVYEQEPIPKDDPIWDCPQLLMTPHVSGDLSLPKTVELVVKQFLEDFERYVRGEQLTHMVDRTRGY